MTKVQPGDVAPDVASTLDDGSTLRLSEQIGRPVVLYFYPQDNTEGCTNENREFSERKAEFDKLGALLVGISPDTIETHVKFRNKFDLKIPLAADPERTAIEAFGLWQLKKLYGCEFLGLIRTSVIIGADGRIVAVAKASRIAGHAQKMLDALRAHIAAQ